tara:strand:- start:3534 stop:3719 length:186 start_codon:yes stop_codon:yes gene_type:complete
MSKIKFDDGIEFDTACDYHLTRRNDGWYVVGNGLLCPVKDTDEGRQVIAEMRSINLLKHKK